MSEKIMLGDRVKDRITGFTGIAVSSTEYLNGCIRIAVDPPVDKDGKSVDQQWFDHQQMNIVEAGAFYKSQVAAKTEQNAEQIGGPPRQNPPRY